MSDCSCICHRGMLWHPVNEFCCSDAVHIKPSKPGPGEHEPYVEVVRAQGNRGSCACGWRTEIMGKADAEDEVDLHKMKTAPKTKSIWDRP